MKRLLSLFLLCAMVLSMLPAAAFAEESCTCQTPCTAEAMNSECPVCGVRDAVPENCACARVQAENDEEETTYCTVTWEYNDGSKNSTQTKGIAGSTVTPPANPTRGMDEQYIYTFDGWYTAAEGGEKLTGAEILTGSVTYYAHWTTTPNTPPAFDPTVALTQFDVVCVNEENGKKIVKSIPLTDLSPDDYTVSKPSLNPNREDSRWTYKIFLKNPADPKLLPDGHRFTGAAAEEAAVWYTSDGTFGGNHYGKIYCTCAPATVTYAPGADGTGSIPAGTKEIGTDLTLSGEVFTRKGYRQIGWATEENGAKVYDLGGTYTADADVTLYPVWQGNQITEVIPYQVVVKQTGNAAPGKVTFVPRITEADPQSGMERLSIQYEGAETDGAGTYNGVVIISGALEDMDSFFSSGFFLTGGDNPGENWTLSDAAYYVTGTKEVYGEDVILPWYPYHASREGGSLVKTENRAGGLIFEHTYTKNDTESTVTYAPGADGTGSIPADTKKPGVPLTLSSAVFTRPGYRQTGWATVEGEYKQYELGDTYTEEADITLYPFWERVYTVSLPLTVEVQQKGTLAPGKKTFSYQLMGFDGSGAKSDAQVSGLSVNTDGAGRYPGVITLTGMIGDFIALSDGFFIRQVSGAAAGWTYSDVVYYVKLDSGYMPMSLDAAGAEPIGYSVYVAGKSGSGYMPTDTAVRTMEFVNTYAENAKRYTITVTNDGHGTGTASLTEAEAGTVITLTAKPNTGYVFKGWQVVSGDVTVESGSFTMPSSDVTVKAVFTREKDATNPKTGDTFRITLWIALLAVSAIGVLALVLLRKKRAR